MTTLRTSQRNARVTLISAFLSDLTFILPIWLLFGTSQLRLSVTATTVLFMMIWVLSGILEIPTGALADRLGRKKMYLVGMVLFSLYPLAYALKLPFGIIALVSVVSAFGSALRSGTLVALTHEAYQADGRSDQSYHAFLSNEKLTSFTARAFSGVLGGLLYTFNPRAPYIAMFLAYFGMTVVGLFAVDTAKTRSKLSNRAHMTETIRQMTQRPIIVMLFGTYITYQLVGEAMWTAYQPIFVHDGLSAEKIGMLFSCMAVVSAGGAFVSRYAMRRFGVQLIELVVASLILISATMLISPSRPLHLAAIIPAAFAFGVSLTPLTATVQKYVSHKFQATALSVVSVAQYLAYGVGSLCVSIMIDCWGVTKTTHVIFVEAIMAVAISLGVYIWKRNFDVIVTPSAS